MWYSVVSVWFWALMVPSAWQTTQSKLVSVPPMVVPALPTWWERLVLAKSCWMSRRPLANRLLPK